MTAQGLSIFAGRLGYAHADRDVCDLSHGGAGRLLPQRGSVAAAGGVAVEPAPAVQSGAGRAADLTRQAVQLYQSAVAAQRAGNWAQYGADLTRLGEVLSQLQATLGGRQP